MSVRTITVELAERSYPIAIGRNLIGGDFNLAAHLAGQDCLIVSNVTVAPLYLDALRRNLGTATIRTVSLADGESHKNLATVSKVLDELVAAGANRDVTVVALGGGVVGDIAGFAAACYMRGVAFIQVPTTLLAQVDSSVGGKTGVNHAQGKNLIGAFHQPRVVLIDTATLATLPDRELRAGLAEVVKYGAIADVEFFSWLEQNMGALLDRDAAAIAHAVERSCEIKAGIVAADECEAGSRAVLNFGHTFGHAIEHCQGYGEWLHGEAVAAGMVMAAELSGIDSQQVTRLRRLVERAGLPAAPPTVGAASLRSAMDRDKKVSAKRLRFVLLERLGRARVADDYDEGRLQQVLESCD